MPGLGDVAEFRFFGKLKLESPSFELAQFQKFGLVSPSGSPQTWPQNLPMVNELAASFEPLSGQLVQLISKLNGCGICFSSRALIPVPQHRTQPWQQEMLNRLVHSWRVGPFKHLKQIVRGDQGADMRLFIGQTASLGEIALITLLQQRVCEIHDAPFVRWQVFHAQPLNW
jgi:hypothetical protein